MDIQLRYETTDVPFKDRFSYWQEAVCDSYVRLGCDAEERSNFDGSIAISRYSSVAISHVKGKAHTVRRRKRDIQAATESYFLLSLQTERSSRVTQFGKTALLNTGDMALYGSSDPYELNLTDDFSQMVVQLPKEKLLARLPNAEMLTARKIDGQSGIGALVRQNILAFSEHANASNSTLQSMVQETLIDLIATGLASQDGSRFELSSPEQHVMLRAKSFIRANLGNRELDRHLVAMEIGLSVRRLNAIFAKEGKSLSSFIRQNRLEAIAADLRDVRFVALSISELALKYGFENFQNFSTSFRSHYGCTPRGYRTASGQC